jgi:predicted AAA+ superfamily ATPase
MKWYTHQGKEAPLYFWRDRSGNEIDLVIDRGERLYPVEIKASQTISAGLFKNLKTWLALKGNKQTSGALVYGGNDFQTRENIQIIPWYAVS